MTTTDQDVAAAYAQQQQALDLRRILIGCLLIVVLLPSGSLIDLRLYPGQFKSFLAARCAFSALMFPFLLFVISPVGRRYHKELGVIMALIPASAMAWIINQADGAQSPFYAGLTLIILGVGLVMRWTTAQSIVAVLAVLALYLVAVYRSIPGNLETFLNNLWFLLLTGIIVVTGNHLQSRLHYRDFESSYRLQQSRQQLEVSNQRLRELDQLKSRFFANISHELRTPLTLMLAPLEALVRQRNGLSEGEIQNLLEVMLNHAMRLLKLINDLLDLARIDSSGVTIQAEPIDLQAFVHGIGNSVQKVADDRRLTLKVSTEGDLEAALCDRDKLEKIALNLLFNAIKFTPAGGRVELRAGAENGDLVLEVIDTGVGIKPEQLPYVFDRFWQADSSSRRRYQGTGIGLALVKELTEALGGRVTVESEVGQGTRMIVRLPYVPAAREAPSPDPSASTVAAPSARPQGKPSPSEDSDWLRTLYHRADLFSSTPSLAPTASEVEATGSSSRPRLLIADDEPDLLRFIRSQLATEFDVIEAADGQEAVEKAAQYLPDVIVCDLMMPRKDGFQVCRELRERSTTSAIPFLLLTARADEETKIEALSAGANDFLSKPFSSVELHVRLKNLVDRHLSGKRLARQNKTLASTLQQLRDTEAQLVHSEKLASLGRMSAGIIHEINNPLNYGLTGLHFLRDLIGELPEDRRAAIGEIVGDVEEGLTRIKTIISDLKTFTHPSLEHRETFELATVVAPALRMVSKELEGVAEVHPEIPDGLQVEANPSQLIQVLVNLLQNSASALALKSFSAPEKALVRIVGEKTPEGVRLSVWDNGQGIDPDDLDKLFEPFFTTKDVGEGMGLGLSICYRIAQAHGGRIGVESEKGRFCRFDLELPDPPA